MTIGTKWRDQAELAAAARVTTILDVAEREASGLVPRVTIERGADELRISAHQLMRRWIAEPGLRFLARGLK